MSASGRGNGAMRWGLSCAGRRDLYKYRYNPIQNNWKGGFEEFCVFFAVVFLESVWGSTLPAPLTSLFPFPACGVRPRKSDQHGGCEEFHPLPLWFPPTCEAGEKTATKKRQVLRCHGVTFDIKSSSTPPYFLVCFPFQVATSISVSPRVSRVDSPPPTQGLIWSGSKPSGHGTSLPYDAVTDRGLSHLQSCRWTSGYTTVVRLDRIREIEF
ncbi:hypothetical protein B0T18DRAFT_19209 [Schizothecium vesticola]|uniref:Uncharacterized protein n=1 Tax=Schizothecium vesticola TaxID=314040 RepID=A0AA40KBY7_9PEZI|nr:hypothetical protein B0T18DRAFT_19209 [Schizothecium vesticola]